jgi:membrane-associated protease RseP (regulator of RpoE activity)
MSKLVLGVVGIIMIFLGIAGLITSWDFLNEPAWLAWIEIIIGVISAFVVVLDSKE